jgi:hypothetical protein
MALEALIDQLSFTHDGQAGEFEHSWDKETMQLSLGGFRTYNGTLTFVEVSYTLLDAPLDVITNRLNVSTDMDSNDINDSILAYLTGAILPLEVEIISEVPATASITAVIDVTYYDFDEVEPVVTLSQDGDCTLSETHTITVTPLAHVNGIAAARGRLLAWDRLNAIYRSALFDPLDFTPSLSTQAAVGQAQAVRGNIILISGFPDGYLVISTDNIVKAKYTGDTYVFGYTELADYGVADPRHVGVSSSQVAIYSSAGLNLVTPMTSQIEGVSDILDTYLAQYAWPITIKLLEDRYICIGLPYLLATDTILLENRTAAPAADLSQEGIIPNYPANAGDFTTLARILVYDIKFKKWGSCDTGAMGLFGCTPLNAAGIKLGKLTLGKEQYWESMSTGLGMINSDLTTWIASHAGSNGVLRTGYLRTQADGWSTILGILPQYMRQQYAPTYTITPYDEDNAVLEAAVWQGTLMAGQPDTTGYALDVTASGNFALKHLRLACAKHGRL